MSRTAAVPLSRIFEILARGPADAGAIADEIGQRTGAVYDRLRLQEQGGNVRRGQMTTRRTRGGVFQLQLWELVPANERPEPAPRQPRPPPPRHPRRDPAGIEPLRRRQAEEAGASRPDIDLAHLRIAGAEGLSAWDLARLRGETLPGPRPGADPVPAPAGARRRLEALEDRGIVRRVSEGGPEARRYALTERA